jgi:hypothetical protein
MVPFPPLIAVTLGVLGAALILRHFAKEWRRANPDLETAKEAPLAESQSEPVRKLRRDPDGSYRP